MIFSLDPHFSLKCTVLLEWLPPQEKIIKNHGCFHIKIQDLRNFSKIVSIDNLFMTVQVPTQIKNSSGLFMAVAIM